MADRPAKRAFAKDDGNNKPTWLEGGRGGGLVDGGVERRGKTDVDARVQRP